VSLASPGPGGSFARPLILSGADVVLPDRVLSPGTVVVEDGRVTEIETGARPKGSGGAGGAGHVDLHGHTLVAGFIDVHVHGVEGFDVLDSTDAVEEIARRLPRFGVTAFCPTAVACSPADLARLIESMQRARGSMRPHARVLPAHLESNFINPEFRGAQPLDCLRLPPRLGLDGRVAGPAPGDSAAAGYSGADVLRVIEAHRADVGIVTMAVELEGGLDLARALVAAGHRVSLGHSGATYEQARAGVEAGARHATHLFNRMSPLTHRAPGLVGAVIASEEIATEIICDGHHVHPVVAAMAIRSKRVARTMAITDGTAGSGLPVGTRVSLGGRTITVTETACYLEDGTLAGSRLTMDGAFRQLVRTGFSLVEASRLCSGTQAEELRLSGQGVIAPGALADLAVLDGRLEVVATYVGGMPASTAVGATA
jgi:N-acetylglucosamine-6-phosphate deacetylase